MSPKDERRRIALTPSHELMEALESFSEASGMSKTTFCNHLLEQNIPMIKSMAKAYAVAFENSELALDIVHQAMFEATEAVQETVVDLEIAVSEQNND